MSKILKEIASNQILSLLFYPPYLSFSLSVFFSQVAFNMLNIVLIFLIFHLTSSNFSVSLLLFAVLIPQILLSFLGGVVGDIADRKKILVLGNLARALILLLFIVNMGNVWMIYLLTLIISAITQFYVPAESPFIPMLVKKDRLVAANSIFGIGLFGSILIGYVLAGPAINIFGRSWVFIILSCFFLIAAIAAFLIPNKNVKKTTVKISLGHIRASIASEFINSYMLLKKTKLVADAFFLLIFSQIIIFILATLIPGYAESILNVKAEDLSLILFGPAALGMLVSALIIGSKLSKVNKNILMTIGIFISGLVLILLPFTSRILSQDIFDILNGFIPSLLKINVFNIVLLLAFFAGFANALIFIPSQAIIQEVIPQDFRSKIYGLLYAFIGVFSLLPILVAGGVADIIGVGAVLFLIGLCIILIGLIREKLLINIFSFIVKRQ